MDFRRILTSGWLGSGWVCWVLVCFSRRVCLDSGLICSLDFLKVLAGFVGFWLDLLDSGWVSRRVVLLVLDGVSCRFC